MKPPLPQIKGSKVLPDWVAETLRLAIMQGYFEPGDKVNQVLIAEELNVSRTPVREALQILESEGFIEIRPHRGAFITQVTREDVRNVYQIRTLLETEAIRQAVSLIPDSVLAELAEYLSSAQRKIDVGDIAETYAVDVRFHNTITSFAENHLLQEMLEGLNNRIHRVRRFIQVRPGPNLPDSFEEHLVILEAMRDRDAARSVELMRQHLEQSAARVMESVQSGEVTDTDRAATSVTPGANLF